MKFKHVCLVFVVALFISMTGIVSAGNTTDDNLAKKIFNKEAVAKEAWIVWEAVNESGNIGTKLIATAVLVWIVVIAVMAFVSGVYTTAGEKEGDANKTSRGKLIMKATVLALIAPPVILALLIMSVGLVL